jgi:hypothetical protein
VHGFTLIGYIELGEEIDRWPQLWNSATGNWREDGTPHPHDLRVNPQGMAML